MLNYSFWGSIVAGWPVLSVVWGLLEYFLPFSELSLNHSFVCKSLYWEGLRGSALGAEVKLALLHLMKPRPRVPSEVFPGLIENSKLLLLETDSPQINGRLLLRKMHWSYLRSFSGSFLVFFTWEHQHMVHVLYMYSSEAGLGLKLVDNITKRPWAPIAGLERSLLHFNHMAPSSATCLEL